MIDGVSELLNPLDRQFADFITRTSEIDSWELWLAAALVNRFTDEGHSCVDLAEFSGRPITVLPFWPEREDRSYTLPQWRSWRSCLEEAPCVGGPGDPVPLILDEKGRLYLERFWAYENCLAAAIRDRVELPAETIPLSSLKKAVQDHFADSDTVGEQQIVAAVAAVLKRITIISGGPGTGKTWIAGRIVSLLNRLSDRPVRVALTAPTGKAANRLSELLSEMGGKGETGGASSGETLHRFIRRLEISSSIPPEVVIVDEASMVDLSLMANLMISIPEETRLICLGDKDQLASVEAGSVMGDICFSRGEKGNTQDFCRSVRQISGIQLPEDSSGSLLTDAIVLLDKNYRFESDSAIAACSRYVNQGDGKLALAALVDGTDGSWHEYDKTENAKEVLADEILTGFVPYLSADNPVDAFQSLASFRILCAMRRGPLGVERVNAWVEEILHEHISSYRKLYEKRPLLITRNDYRLGLFNGDIGVLWRDGSDGELAAYFQDSDGRLRSFAPALLPDHETAFAMTVHKSQGSEFEKVLFLLPQRDSRVLTRELLYTGMTRARSSLSVWGSRNNFITAATRPTQRSSGLVDKLGSQTPLMT